MTILHSPDEDESRSLARYGFMGRWDALSDAADTRTRSHPATPSEIAGMKRNAVLLFTHVISEEESMTTTWCTTNITLIAIVYPLMVNSSSGERWEGGRLRDG